MMNNFENMMEILANGNEYEMTFTSRAIECMMVASYGKTDTLEVTLVFNGDRPYGYHLPLEIVKGLMMAESVGRYYNTHIRHTYKGERL